MKESLDVHLHSNYTCNLKCKHCYNHSGEGCQDVMSEVHIIRLIRLLSDNYNTDIHLEGGEIFLLPDLLSKLDDLPSAVLERITITTNGTLTIHDKKALSALKKISALRISVEGHTNAQQMLVRGTDLDSVLKNAEQYLRNGLPVWLRITLSGINRDSFVSDTLPTLQNKGFKNIQVYEFQSVGRGKSVSELLSMPCSIQGFLNDLVKFKERLTGNIRIMLPGRRVPEVMHNIDILEECGYSVHFIEPEKGISIHPDGNVFRCAWDNNMEHSLCNVHSISDDAFLTVLKENTLEHECEFCSAVRIIKA